MRPFFLLLLGIVIYGVSDSFAEMYRYVDDQGVIHYTNDLSNVPEDKRSAITEESEYQSDGLNTFQSPKAPPPPSQQVPFNSDSPSKKRKADQEKQIAALKAEYKSLLIEKAAIDNDDSFQKRKTKTKYKHRPYIEAIAKREEQIKQRLSEIETALNQLESAP